jgi:hypothetical protein
MEAEAEEGGGGFQKCALLNYCLVSLYDLLCALIAEMDLLLVKHLPCYTSSDDYLEWFFSSR